MAERGGFGTPVEPNKIKGSIYSGTEKGTTPPEIIEIADRWQELPEHIKLSILALVRSVKGGV
jgi:hypothetical protein